MTTPDIARQHLAEWQKAQPTNFFTTDLGFQRTLELLWGTADYKGNMARLYQFGGLVATTLAAAANHLVAHPPILHPHDPFGQPQNRVELHPDSQQIAQHLWQAGLTAVYAEKGHNLLGLALFYLFSQLGEAGYTGPVLMTVGVIKGLQNAAASPHLPLLLDPAHPFTAAQWFSEIQSGSDLGDNAVFAYSDDAGNWFLTGEKWFCAHVTANLSLVTARVAGQGDGTAGLGLFLVPRQLQDGSRNGLTIQRLKNTMGSRSLAIGDVTFHDALAYPIGPLEQGYAYLTAHIQSSNWLYNALACCGRGRRAYLTAWTYAEHRYAFGQPILHYPLIQDTLTQMRADVSAMLSGTLRLAKLVDEQETGEAKEGTAAILRLAIPLNQIRSATFAHELIHQGMEVLGGNGTLEDFSPLPGLLRDNLSYEHWTGSPNNLLAQIQRDMRQARVHEPFIQLIRSMLQPSPFEDLRRETLFQLSQLEQELADFLVMDELSATVPLRPLLAHLMDLFYVACLAVEGAWEYLRKDDRSKQRLAEFFLNRRVLHREAKEIADYAHQISKLCKDIRPWKIDWDKDRELRQQYGDWVE